MSLARVCVCVSVSTSLVLYVYVNVRDSGAMRADGTVHPAYSRRRCQAVADKHFTHSVKELPALLTFSRRFCL